jgi:hypothetical protein
MIPFDFISRREDTFTYFYYVNHEIKIHEFTGKDWEFQKMIEKIHHQMICEILCDFIKFEKKINHSGKNLLTYTEAIQKVRSFIKYIFDNLGNPKNISYSRKIHKEYLNVIMNFIDEENPNKKDLKFIMYQLDKTINHKISVYAN